MTWCASRQPQLNTDKTEAIWFGSRASIDKLSSRDRTLTIGETTINTTDVGRNFGVLLDSQLSMKQHVATFAVLCQIRRRVRQEVTTRLVLAMVTTRLDYCNSLLVGHRNRLWSYGREFKTAQCLLFLISGNGITSHQFFSSCTGCQFRLAYVRSCTEYTTVNVRRTCLMRCSPSRLCRHVKDHDRLPPRIL